MSRRLRLLSSLAALAVGCAVALALAPRARQPARATAADDCIPKPGDTTLGTALLHVPAGAKAPLPLVMAFHGAGGTGPGMAGYSGLSATADRYGFAVLYPTAGSSRHFWSLNAKMAPDDVGGIRALLPQAEQAACADPARIYATGVSNGGGFSARLGCELAGPIPAPPAGAGRDPAPGP